MREGWIGKREGGKGEKICLPPHGEEICASLCFLFSQRMLRKCCFYSITNTDLAEYTTHSEGVLLAAALMWMCWSHRFVSKKWRVEGKLWKIEAFDRRACGVALQIH